MHEMLSPIFILIASIPTSLARICKVFNVKHNFMNSKVHETNDVHIMADNIAKMFKYEDSVLS